MKPLNQLNEIHRSDIPAWVLRKCSEHPKYTAIRKPKSGCYTCWSKYARAGGVGYVYN